MSLLRQVRAFVGAPAARRRLAVEAALEIAHARLVTLGPARFYTPRLGKLGDPSAQPMTADPVRADPVSTDEEQTAARIGQMVARVAAGLPIGAHCLQQAMAVRRMLARRGIPSEVCLGIARDRKPDADRPRAAHAWVTVGSRIVSGGEGREDFAVVARFA